MDVSNVVTFLPLLNNLSPEFFPNILSRLSVVTSIDIADSFTALLSPEHNQNTNRSHWPMRGLEWVPVTNQRSDSDNLCSNHDPSRCSSHKSLNQDASDTDQLSTARHQPRYLIQNSAMTKIFPEMITHPQPHRFLSGQHPFRNRFHGFPLLEWRRGLVD